MTQAQWWSVRRAHSRRPATYRCPLCGRRLHAMSEHELIAPEGDTTQRRHAHSACVMRAHEAGRLPFYDDWRKTQPRRTLLDRIRAQYDVWRRALTRKP
jgi:hypothetical protein